GHGWGEGARHRSARSGRARLSSLQICRCCDRNGGRSWRWHRTQSKTFRMALAEKPSRFGAGLNDAGANEKVSFDELGVAHTILVALEVIGLDTNGLGQFQVGARVGPLAKRSHKLCDLADLQPIQLAYQPTLLPRLIGGIPLPAKSQRAARGHDSDRRFE